MVVFEIFHEPSGLWRIRRTDGLVEGCFKDQRTAIRFARHQYPDAMIVFLSEKKLRPSAVLAAAG